MGKNRFFFETDIFSRLSSFVYLPLDYIESRDGELCHSSVDIVAFRLALLRPRTLLIGAFTQSVYDNTSNPGRN